MRVGCILTAKEIMTPAPDLIVFPEGVAAEEMDAACCTCPESIVVGAVVDNGWSRGVVSHQGRNRIRYLKLGTDGRTRGTEDLHQDPVYHWDDMCVGVLICMDVGNVPFSQAVIARIRSSPAKRKLLCVPSDMTSDWDVLAFPRKYEGVHVALCNHTKTYQGAGRCKSFIAGPDGRTLAEQVEHEPIYANLSQSR